MASQYPGGDAAPNESDAYGGQGAGPYWHAQIEASEQDSQKWVEKAKKVVKRYRDERDAIESQRKKFNVLWSNTQVLIPALYGRKPKPDVSRRFLDDDPDSRLASMMLERCNAYEIENYPDFEAAMKGAVEDRLLPGRGVTWVRYEPNIVTVEPQPTPDAEVQQEGAGITDDTEMSPQAEPAQRIVSAHAPCDYVYWQDFLYSPARTWEEVWWVGRWVYMTKEEGLERFGEVFKLVPCDSTEADQSWKSGKSQTARARLEKKAKVAEVWNKRTGRVCWVAKGYPQALDERDDFLKLDGFFPCPRPLFATTTTSTLIPVPDFCEYQDQAAEIDDLTQRIAMLTKACKAVGVFNAQYKELARMMNEGVDNRLFPVDSWAAYAEKGGMKGAIEFLDISTVAAILKQLYEGRDRALQVIYQVSGISDIIRGSTDPNETLGAQQLKANFGSLRLKSSQQDVARYASDLFRMKTQIIARFYPEELIVKMSGVLHTEDGKNPERLANALKIIKSTEMREFSIQVESDTLAQIDEQAEKQQAVEFTQAVGSYFKEVVPLIQVAPSMLKLVSELLLFNVRRFRAGRPVEAAFESAMRQMEQQMQAKASQPQQPPEQVVVEQMKQQGENEREAARIASQEKTAAAELAMKDTQHQREMAMQSESAAAARADARADGEANRGMEKMRIRADTLQKGIKGINPDSLEVVPPDQDPEVLLMKELVQGQQQTLQALAAVAQGLGALAQKLDATAQLLTADREIERGPDGRAIRSRIRAPQQMNA